MKASSQREHPSNGEHINIPGCFFENVAPGALGCLPPCLGLLILGCCLSDTLSTAFYEPVDLVEFTSRMLNRKVRTIRTPLNDADRVRVRKGLHGIPASTESTMNRVLPDSKQIHRVRWKPQR
jgi:hypothetical protein